MVAFVILHYQTTEETEQCVESVLNMKRADEARVVVVDNASPNGSGTVLQKKWKDNENIKVILNDENAGFSRGNNIGCMYAREAWNPDYYVVANNDIIFRQDDFIDKIEHEYETTGYYVLGPDIYDISNHVHQSPMAECEPTKGRVKLTLALNNINLLLYPITYRMLRKYYSGLSEKATDAEYYDVRKEYPFIMGACIVFAGKYVEERLKEPEKMQPFYPETRFYYEEAILCNWCRKNGKKIVYSPDIRVEHINGGATRTNKDMYARIKSQMINLRDSARIYLKEL